MNYSFGLNVKCAAALHYCYLPAVAVPDGYYSKSIRPNTWLLLIRILLHIYSRITTSTTLHQDLHVLTVS